MRSDCLVRIFCRVVLAQRNPPLILSDFGGLRFTNPPYKKKVFSGVYRKISMASFDAN